MRARFATTLFCECNHALEHVSARTACAASKPAARTRETAIAEARMLNAAWADHIKRVPE